MNPSNVDLLTPGAVAARVRELKWWHHIDLGSVVTPGRSDLRQQFWVASCLPQNFAGARVLDVGAWDGFFSFLAERRGARRVVAIDSFQNPQDHADTPLTFALAKEVLQSSVEYQRVDLFDLTPPEEPFDAALFLGVYYHLKGPMAALEKIRGLLRPGGKLFLEGLIRLGNGADLHYYDPTDIEPTTFCAATVPGLERMCRLAGFQSARMTSRTDGIKTKAWYYTVPPSRLHWELVSFYRRLVFPSSRPRAFFEVTA